MHPDPRPTHGKGRSSRGRRLVGAALFVVSGVITATTEQRHRMGVAQLVAHRSPKPAVGGSSPSAHANRGRSHGHRTRDQAERSGRIEVPG